MKRTPQVIVALDVDTLREAKHLVERLSPAVKIFKVGSQLFSGCGPQIIEFIRRKHREVFLDLKFFDIPNTVANAARQAVRLKVKMFTVHIAGGEDMLRAALKAAKEESRRLKLRRPLLIGVTVLTSKDAGFSEVLALARSGLRCGLDGVVASVRETALLRRALKSKFVIITPGIRPRNASLDDQKRVATAEDAVKAGSDFLVVGRPIVQAKDPLKAARELLP